MFRGIRVKLRAFIGEVKRRSSTVLPVYAGGQGDTHDHHGLQDRCCVSDGSPLWSGMWKSKALPLIVVL